MAKTTSKNKELCEVVKIFESHFSKNDKKSGLFGIEARAEQRARKLEASLIEEEILEQDRGYQGATRKCPKCGRTQKYRGDRERIVRFECGEFKVKRAYYNCEHCGTSSVPLDEQLGIVEGQEQGRLREKLCLLGVLIPYHQGQLVCQILLGQPEYSSTIKRVVGRESERLADVEEQRQLESTLPSQDDDTLYIEIDGHMCPTREPRRDQADQGYREAKVVMAFNESSIANISKDRNEILSLILKGEIASASNFSQTVSNIYDQANGTDASRVVVIGDGAKWIWNIASEVIPEAIQILDYSHAKSYLWKAGNLIYGTGSDLAKSWVERQKTLLFDDKIDSVIDGITQFRDVCPELGEVITYLDNNRSRMFYGRFRSQGLFIGSGAIESAGKRIAQGRVKGCGMRWNVPDLNQLLRLRCTFLDSSWTHFWDTQYDIAA